MVNMKRLRRLGFDAGGRRRLQLFMIFCVVTASVFILARLDSWSLLNLKAFDYLSTIDGLEPPPNGPVIVGIDEPSLSNINIRWPWPRSLHGKLISALRAAGAKVIGFDIILAEPSQEDEDRAFAAALGPDVVLAADETLIRAPQADQLVRTTPMPMFTDTGAGSGVASIGLGGDGVFRRVPKFEDGFARVVARTAGLAAAGKVEASLVQSFGPARSYPTVSYYQALDPTNFLPPDFFRGRIVLVGLSLQTAPKIDAGGADAFATSYTVHTGRLVSGVEIQATLLDNITRNLAISRGPSWAEALAVVVAAALGCLTVLRSTSAFTAVFALASMCFVPAASFLYLRMGHLYIGPVGPLIAYAALVSGQTAVDYSQERRAKREITRAFSQYLSPDLVRRLSDDPSQLKLGGERRTLSILFSDIRGFTTIAESMSDEPERLTALINRVLTPLSDIIMNYGGTIDKYMGDCIMAFWNAPLDDADHAVHAVTAALAMQDAIENLNVELAKEAEATGLPYHSVRMGVGINTGECVVGNMGSTRRFDYSCLGDAVNLASRLEGASKNYGVSILLGEETAALVREHRTVVELDRITVKGRVTASPIFTVIGCKDILALKEHALFIQARYSGALALDTASYGRMKSTLPELSAYYGTMQEFPVG